MAGDKLNEFAERITAAYAVAVTGVIQAAVKLREAKASLQHGEWIPFCNSIRISRFRAAKLLKIAEHAGLTKPDNAHVLPLDEEVLYVLAQMGERQFEIALSAGDINPDLTRAAAIRLRDG